MLESPDATRFYQATPTSFQQSSALFHAAPAFARDRRVHHQAGDLRSPYVVAVTIEDEIAAELTARAMGWVPVEGEDSTRILESGSAQRTSVSMARRTATQRSKWCAPTHTENKVSNHGGQSPAFPAGQALSALPLEADVREPICHVGDRFPVALTPGHHGPRHAGDLVGERNRSDFGRPPRQQPREPGPMTGAMDLGIAAPTTAAGVTAKNTFP
jgi:hypothetical protein